MKLPNCTSAVTEEELQHVYTSLNQVPIKSVSQLFKVLSDETRVKIAHALTIQDELCVCDVAAITDTSVASASHHLRTLKKHGLAKIRKDGKNVYYSLDDHHVHDLIKIAIEHQEELEE
ncbi:ArsR/SmtB family transcription factor [Piscibacillus sp. B03]|uniref:ArsR/SmtB family transcription factor n=1 Tax=Piscibacillus sp. B03 TaxID=3457430 RepID=UPI003FCD652C